MDVSYIINLPVKCGVSIDQVSTPQRDLVGPIQWGTSYLELTSEEYEHAVTLLCSAVANSARELLQF
jgi:hypothetical protein